MHKRRIINRIDQLHTRLIREYSVNRCLYIGVEVNRVQNDHVFALEGDFTKRQTNVFHAGAE